MTNFIKPCIGRITSPFGYRIHPIRKVRSWHQGVDIAYPGTVNIRASADGIVIRVGELGTYGNVVMIRHNINGELFETNYAHLRDGLKVVVGQKVKQGDVIAHMGNTGSSTAQHLHFEIHKGKWATGQPNAVNPEKYMGDEFVQLEEKKPVEKPVVTPVAKPKEEKKLLKIGILVGSHIDLPSAYSVATRKDAPILLGYKPSHGEVAKELIVIGGEKDGLIADKITVLSGKDRFETSRNVEKYLG
jgi:hypothetical protein